MTMFNRYVKLPEGGGTPNSVSPQLQLQDMLSLDDLDVRSFTVMVRQPKIGDVTEALGRTALRLVVFAGDSWDSWENRETRAD